jgi:4-amino-4-deoxy-L-arabinose transferase-like glycosyltransferase
MNQFSELCSFLPQSTLTLLTLSGIAIAVTTFFVFRFPNSRWNYTGIFAAVALAGSAFALISPFLYPWDEQYHALVAKNMMRDPFHPRLLNGPIVIADSGFWIETDTWLHKQPLFLWQIALSMKVFGSNLFALRLPGILMHAAATCLVFAVGKRYLRYFFAFLACLLFGFSGYILDFISGVQGMDHNDIAFLFYVTASLWSWHKYYETRKLKWALITGILSGGAILCKWLVGLIVYAGWGSVVLIYERRNLRAWKDLLAGVAATIAIAGPWQLYCLLRWPELYKEEVAYNSKHFTEALEGHYGERDFYFDKARDLYGTGELMRWLVIAGLVLTVIAALRRRKPQLLFGAIAFTLVYAFFTIAETKMEGYVLVVAGLGFIFQVTPAERISELIKKRSKFIIPGLVLPFLALAVLYLSLNARGVTKRHNFLEPWNASAWTDDLKLGKTLIDAAPEGTRYILVKNMSMPAIAALRFMTGKWIYPWTKEREGLNVAVIDLHGAY